MARKKSNPLRKVRIAVASAVLVSFTLLFANPGGVFTGFFHFLLKLQFWPSVLAVNVGAVILFLTLSFVFGRVYCSFLCPLGITQDAVYGIYGIVSKGKIRRTHRYSKPLNAVRYIILFFFIIAVASGYAAVADLIEPYSIFGRAVSSVTQRNVFVIVSSAVTLAIIFFLVWKKGRIWCNSICPVGAVLSLPGRKALFAPSIDRDKCISCNACTKVCRSSCINVADGTVDTSRCVVCFDCLDSCATGALAYRYRKPVSEKRREGGGRRAFLGTAAFALSTLALKAVGNPLSARNVTAKRSIADVGGTGDTEGHGILAELKPRESPVRGYPVIPPGSRSLKNFSQHCVACQLCVNSCPSKVLVPGSDLEHFLQPRMNFEKGFCRPECTVCSQLCPTGAITEISVEEKSSISIGHAVYDFDKCVVNTDGVSCGNCARHCPAGAISMVKLPSDSEEAPRRIPVVNTERCIGCGRCEYVCPSRPVSAIHVEGNETHRIL